MQKIAWNKIGLLLTGTLIQVYLHCKCIILFIYILKMGRGQIFGPGAPRPKPRPVPGAPNIIWAYLAVGTNS